MGRPPKFTPEEAKKRRKQSLKNSKQKFNAKVKSDPELHEKEKAQKRNSQAKRIANMTPEEKKAYNEYQKIKKQESRTKKENKTKKIPSKTALSSITKPIQLKVSCETASEIGIQKKTSSAEVKKAVHSPVETTV